MYHGSVLSIRTSTEVRDSETTQVSSPSLISPAGLRLGLEPSVVLKSMLATRIFKNYRGTEIMMMMMMIPSFDLIAR